MVIKSEREINEDTDFNVEIKVCNDVINLLRVLFDGDSIGDTELAETVLTILTNMYNEERRIVIPFKYVEEFQLSTNDSHKLEMEVALVNKTFKGFVKVKESDLIQKI